MIEYSDNDRAAILAEFWLMRLCDREWERQGNMALHDWYAQQAMLLIAYNDLRRFPVLAFIIDEQLERLANCEGTA